MEHGCEAYGLFLINFVTLYEMLSSTFKLYNCQSKLRE
jgi:hypothetical protein